MEKLYAYEKWKNELEFFFLSGSYLLQNETRSTVCRRVFRTETVYLFRCNSFEMKEKTKQKPTLKQMKTSKCKQCHVLFFYCNVIMFI